MVGADESGRADSGEAESWHCGGFCGRPCEGIKSAALQTLYQYSDSRPHARLPALWSQPFSLVAVLDELQTAVS